MILKNLHVYSGSLSQANPGEVGNSIKHAIDIGYRLFDCAWIYGNEKEIGEGLRAKIEDGTVKRDELYVITKLWNTFHEEENVCPVYRMMRPLANQ
ncbi:hypothetical protein JTB14_028794 [Gonioctena quinquepunctata]|nr:hypothetical protein JTB14_028794 [Gonioctena quinquepunctata]